MTLLRAMATLQHPDVLRDYLLEHGLEIPPWWGAPARSGSHDDGDGYGRGSGYGRIGHRYGDGSGYGNGSGTGYGS